MTMICVTVMAGRAAWEAQVLAAVAAAPGQVVVKRCVDVDDLLASATTQQSEVAVVDALAAGWDAAAISHLLRHHLVPVVVVPQAHPEVLGERLAAAGVEHVLAEEEIGEVASVIAAASQRSVRRTSGPHVADATAEPAVDEGAPGLDSVPAAGLTAGASAVQRSVIAVWGPVGAPGRTTIATGLAGAMATRGRPTVVVDADPHAAVAQTLGVTEEISGLLAAARMAGQGTVESSVAGACRAVTPRLGVLTGLPRPDRRDEVVAGTLTKVLRGVAAFADVVVDLGSSLDDPFAERGAWNLEVLEQADVVLVVGSADPVGLTRMVHALGDLAEMAPEVTPVVVVNRLRSTLGWGEREVRTLLASHVPHQRLHFLVEDRANVDRALVDGRSVSGFPGELASGLLRVAEALVPLGEGASPTPPRQRWRPGRVGVKRERQAAKSR